VTRVADVQAEAALVAVAAAKILNEAIAQKGTPYVYGGEEPKVGFDCSGLAQWCCALAGIAIPRGSAAQFTGSGPRVDGDIRAGDLVFFYGGESTGPRPGHVGIALNSLYMIDAPYTGVDVRQDSYVIKPTIGPLDFWGATRPAALVVPPAPLPPPATLEDVKLRVLSEGCKGYDVQSLQILLNGKNVAELAIDSIFGPQTLAAVKAYQHKLGYKVDGIVGAATWRSILGAPNP
jgi:peptidoglycan hydrolase-like protein with peptidoglycan-binding domain